MIKALAILIAAGLLAAPSLAQGDTSEEGYFPSNAIFAEAGGAGIGFSLNFERLVSDRFGLRVGYGVSGYEMLVEQTATGGFLLGGVYLIPISTWAAERGGSIEIGATAGRLHTRMKRLFSNQVEEWSQTTVALQASYSYRPTSRGLFFRIGGGPLMSFSHEGATGIPYFSASIGGAF
jgi:hypothetical protein